MAAGVAAHAIADDGDAIALIEVERVLVVFADPAFVGHRRHLEFQGGDSHEMARCGTGLLAG